MEYENGIVCLRKSWVIKHRGFNTIHDVITVSYASYLH